MKKIEKTPLKDDHEYSRLIQEKHQEALNPNAETSIIPYEITNDGYKCTLCDKVYMSQPNFKYHFDKHHPRTGRSYKCGQCDKFFQSFQIFHDHMLLHKRESRQGQRYQPRYQITSGIKIAAVQGNIRESIKIPTEKVLEGFHRKISNPKPTQVTLEKRDGTMVKVKEDGSLVTIQQRLSNIVLDKNLIMIVPQNMANSLINSSEDQNVQENSKITTIINPEVQKNDSSSQIIKIKPPNQINNEAVANQSTSIGKSIQIDPMPIDQDFFDTVRTGGIQNTAIPIINIENERENRNVSPVTSSSGTDNSNRWSTTWCGHKSSFKMPPKNQREKPKIFPLLSKKNQRDSELPLQIKSVQSLSDRGIISKKEGNPENDVGESDMQIQISSVQGNVGKLYHDCKILPLEHGDCDSESTISANELDIEDFESTIIKQEPEDQATDPFSDVISSDQITEETTDQITEEITDQISDDEMSDLISPQNSNETGHSLNNQLEYRSMAATHINTKTTENSIRSFECHFPAPVSTSSGPSTISPNPTLATKRGYPVPVGGESMDLTAQTTKRHPFFPLKCQKTEAEVAAIVDECTVELYSPTFLAEKYNITVASIRRWVKEAGKFLPQKYMYNAAKSMLPTDNKCPFCSYEDPPKENQFGGGWVGLNLNDHLFKAHKHCKQCNTTFKASVNLDEHLFNKHNFLKDCEFCNFIVYDKSLMSQHMESKHGQAMAKKPKIVEQSEQSQYSVEIKCKTCKVKKGFGRRILMQHHCVAHNFCLDCEVEFDDTLSAFGKDLFRNGRNTSPNFIF